MITQEHSLIDLPFWLFVYLADTDAEIGVQESDRFFNLLNSPSWCKNKQFKQTLALTAEQYSTLWKSYLKQGNESALGHFAQGWNHAIKNNDDVGSLSKDILHFGKKIIQSSADKPLLGLSKSQKVLLDNVKQVMDDPDRLAELQKHELAAKSDKNKKTASSADSSRASVMIAPDGSVTWSKGKIMLKCVQVIDETHDVKTFRFECADLSKLFFYKPGQFLTIELQVDDKKVRRSYTISSTPSRPKLLSITVKRVEGGLISNWLHDNMLVGGILTGRGPNGGFNCIDIPAQKILLMSGGSGITPVMSMLRWFYDTSAEVDLVFMHAARTPDDLIYQKELEHLDSQMPNLKLIWICSKADDAWQGYTGRISIDIIQQAVPDFKDRTIYNCGPLPYMDAVKNMLEQDGFAMPQYHEESFGGVVPASHDQAMANHVTQKLSPVSEEKVQQVLAEQQQASVEHCDIHLAQSGESCEGSCDDFILDVADDAGIELPCNCRAGTCGTCKVKLLEGKVEHEQGLSCISAEEIEDGFVLTCSARAKGRVVLDI